MMDLISMKENIFSNISRRYRECLICGEVFKKITITHLKYKHAMDFQDYYALENDYFKLEPIQHNFFEQPERDLKILFEIMYNYNDMEIPGSIKEEDLSYDYKIKDNGTNS